MDEQAIFKSNFRNRSFKYIDLVRVTNITNTPEAKRDFQQLIYDQEWQFGPIVRIHFVSRAKCTALEESTTIAFVQLSITPMHYHLIRQFQSFKLHNHHLCFQMAGESNDLIVEDCRFHREYEAHRALGIDYFYNYERIDEKPEPNKRSTSQQTESNLTTSCSQQTDTITVRSIEQKTTSSVVEPIDKLSFKKTLNNNTNKIDVGTGIEHNNINEITKYHMSEIEAISIKSTCQLCDITIEKGSHVSGLKCGHMLHSNCMLEQLVSVAKKPRQAIDDLFDDPDFGFTCYHCKSFSKFGLKLSPVSKRC
jgi:hypothetical protein